jgi:putative membrane protein
MKIPFVIRLGILVGITVLNLAFLPVSNAQTSTNSPPNPTGSSENSKVDESSTAERHDAALGNSTDQTGTLDKTPSKNPSATTTGQKSTEQGNNSENKNGSSLVKSDQKFIEDAAQGGMTEVQLGQIAQEKGTSPDVKQFGSRMVADHSKANDELKSLAQQKGLSVPNALDRKHQAMVDHFQKLSGPAFDRAYVHNMVKDHQEDAAEFQKVSTSAQDPDVKAFASKTLNVIQSHLADVQNIQTKIGR